MLMLILICTVVLLVGIHFSIHGTKAARILNKIDGPALYPIIGNAHVFLQGPVKSFYFLRAMANKFKKSFRMFVFHISIINLIDPEDIEIILSSTKHISKNNLYDFIRPWLNDGLLTSTGEKWHARRKILTPTFHFNILQQFCTIFVEQSDKMIQRLKAEIGKPETAVQPHIAKATLHSICETAMGTDLDAESANSNSYVSSIYEYGEYFIYRIARVWLTPDFLFNLTNIGKKTNKVVFEMHKFTKNVIKERRIERNISGNKFEVINSFNTGKKRLAMLDLLLSAEEDNKINEEGIQEEVDTFMFEGHDTTTMALTFCFMLLANNPEIQETVYSEIYEIFGDTDVQATIKELNEMQYLERCIKESLRLYPSVPFIGRMFNEDVQFKNFLVPAGTPCNIHIFDVHRNEKYFPNPTKFDPDRFLPENTANRHAYAYIPFSAGPRNCIGQKFAMLELKAIISAVLRNFKLEPVTKPEDLIFIADLVLRTENPVKVKFVARNKI